MIYYLKKRVNEDIMTDKQTELNLLPMNKTVLYNTTLSDDICIVRTGTVNGDDITECLIHAALSAYSREYFELDDQDRVLFLKKFKANLLKKPIDYLPLCKKAIEEIYNFIEFHKQPDKVSVTNKTSAKLITEYISKELQFYTLLLNILPCNDCIDLFSLNIDTMSYRVTDYLLKSDKLAKIDRKKLTSIKDKVIKFLSDIITYTKKFYKEEDIISDITNVEFMTSLSNKLKRNILFIDSISGLPYNISDDYDYNIYPKSIVVLKIKEKFEILGILKERNYILRDINITNAFIEKILSFLSNDDDIPDENINDKVDEEIIDNDII